MANQYTNEAELFQRIKDEKVTFHPLLWDAIYEYLGDKISSIELVVEYSHGTDRDMSKEDCEKVVFLVEEIGKMIHKIAKTDLIQEEDNLSPVISEIQSIPQYVIDLLQHHIANDCHAVGFIMGDAADTGFGDRESQERVLGRTTAMIDFLEKLRKVTYKSE